MVPYKKAFEIFRMQCFTSLEKTFPVTLLQTMWELFVNTVQSTGQWYFPKVQERKTEYALQRTSIHYLLSLAHIVVDASQVRGSRARTNIFTFIVFAEVKLDEGFSLKLLQKEKETGQ